MTQFIDLQHLEGKWYINMTNFPMWLKGDKTKPTFNYSIKKRGKTIGLRDDVQYVKNGKTKHILGFDKPENTTNSKFTWRGKGLLRLLKSEWEILHFDKEHEIIVIYFKKTLFTPEGYDVVSRKPTLTKKEIAYFQQIIIQKGNEKLEVL